MEQQMVSFREMFGGGKVDTFFGLPVPERAGIKIFR
jgi:hypothetical protein